jgi:hypothetical protein
MLLIQLMLRSPAMMPTQKFAAPNRFGVEFVTGPIRFLQFR